MHLQSRHAGGGMSPFSLPSSFRYLCQIKRSLCVLSTGSSKWLFCLGDTWKAYINARGRVKAIWRWQGMFVQVIALTLLQGKSCSAREEMLSCERRIQGGLTSRCWRGHGNGENTARLCNYSTWIYHQSCHERGTLLELLTAELGSAGGGDFGSLSWSLL